MRYRSFGRTGLQISEFTFGGGAVGGILVRAAEDVRRAALERAVAAGCNWIDTAADYGQGESERTLGRLLAGLNPQPDVSTKVRIDPARLDDLAGQIRASIEASLTRLRMDRVALFQLHNPVAPQRGGGALALHDVLRPGGVADVFDRLRQEGLFTFQGITALGETQSIIELLRAGRFDTAQVYHNVRLLLDRSATSLARPPMVPNCRTPAPPPPSSAFSIFPPFTFLNYVANLAPHGLGRHAKAYADWTWGQVSEGDIVYTLP